MLGAVSPFPCFITRSLHSSRSNESGNSHAKKPTEPFREGRILGQKTDGFVLKEGRQKAEKKLSDILWWSWRSKNERATEMRDRHTVNSVTISNRGMRDKSVKIAVFLCECELRGLVMDKRLFGDVLCLRLEILS